MDAISLEHIAALALFAFVASVTPGPNTLMLLASGANYGFRATLPHMAGITIGFGLMLLGVGLGIGALFRLYPQIAIVLKWAGAAYLLYLAWRIANAGPPDTAAAKVRRPFTFIEAAAFQWINPKAWAVGIAAMATYTVTGHHNESMTLIVAAFVVSSIVVTPAWTLFGVGLRRLLSNPRTRRAFNITMALLLVATLIPVFTGAL